MKLPIPAIVLGATGTVGQRFIQLLERHPWFKVVAVTGSDRSIGQRYEDACHWLMTTPIPEDIRQMRILPSEPHGVDAAIAFSALPADSALEIEPAFARAGIAVCTNASTYRQEPDVPLLLPEVNPDHIALIQLQRRRRGWSGLIAANPNCTITGLTIALKPIQDAFGLKQLMLVSMQAISGAGFPGISSYDIMDNVVPFIQGEEEKLEFEPRKMLGRLVDEEIELAEVQISAQANRVPVVEGHTVCASILCEAPIDASEALQEMEAYRAPEISLGLPSTPDPVIQVRKETNRPQPRLDIQVGRGMTTVVGRIRKDRLFHLKFVVVSHNTVRGAAGGSIYNAELLAAQNLL